MNRRGFLQTLVAASAASTLPSPTSLAGSGSGGHARVMSVTGSLDASEMGITLTHEHLFANLQPYTEWAQKALPYDRDEVVDVVLPHLTRIRKLGCRTLIDCTATHVGRDPVLLKRLSEASGLRILTVTGNYASADGRFLPPYVFTDSVEALSRRWIDEWEKGIEGTGIRPGLIKLGFNGGALTDVERKLIRASALAHLKTGLTIGAHTGPWRKVERGFTAVSAFEQLAQLEEAGVAPSAWIWIHSQNETDGEQRVRAARRGAWISFDGFRPDLVADYVGMVRGMRSEGLLHRVLISQDAGWYHAGEPKGGEFSPFDPLFTALVPALRQAGLAQAEVDTLLVDNPAAAFSIRVRS